MCPGISIPSPIDHGSRLELNAGRSTGRPAKKRNTRASSRISAPSIAALYTDTFRQQKQRRTAVQKKNTDKKINYFSKTELDTDNFMLKC